MQLKFYLEEIQCNAHFDFVVYFMYVQYNYTYLVYGMQEPFVPAVHSSNFSLIVV